MDVWLLGCTWVHVGVGGCWRRVDACSICVLVCIREIGAWAAHKSGEQHFDIDYLKFRSHEKLAVVGVARAQICLQKLNTPMQLKNNGRQ